MRRRWAEITIGLLVAVAVAVVLIGRTITSTTHGTATSAAAVTIPAADGTRLSAYVVPPRGGSTKTHAPLLIMPASWASGSREYLGAAKNLADDGYEVISYAQRGFRPSTGAVDFAAAKTQADVSTVIDWALAHTGADKNRIGAIGISYGAGISLLGAERDARIKAVVGMTAWADLGAAMDPNHTLNKLALAGLMSSGAGAGTLDTELAGVRDGLQLGLTQAGEAMLNAPDRSPSSDVAALNRNKTAVMIANGYQDSLIVPNQLVTFFDQLTGPKRLELRVGDHGGPESSGLTGAANDVWQSATRWLDHYVRGASNGVQSDDPIQLKDAVTGQWHAYKDWASVGTGTSLPLGAASGAAATGALGGTSEAWTRTIATGVDTVANSGTAAYIDKPNFVLPCGTPISRVNRANAAVWTGPAAAQPTLISGEPHLRVNVTSSGTAATFFAYLYDVDPVRGGCLVSYAPYTSQSMNPGVAQTVDVDLGTIAWTMPAGHHLALVIDTVDARYANHNVPGTTLTFASTPAAPATFTLPTA